MNGWKITAIIFIVLFCLETAFLGWSVSVYNTSVKNENICIYEVCDLEESNDFDNYYYDDIENICSCYKDDKIAKTKQL